MPRAAPSSAITLLQPSDHGRKIIGLDHESDLPDDLNAPTAGTHDLNGLRVALREKTLLPRMAFDGFKLFSKLVVWAD
jgi:hypothetical protein